MRKVKLVSFLVLSLALSVALPALVLGQSVPKPPGGKPTPVPTSTPTPVIGDDDGDVDEDGVGCLGALDFLCNWGGCYHFYYSKFDGQGRCERQ